MASFHIYFKRCEFQKALEITKNTISEEFGRPDIVVDLRTVPEKSLIIYDGKELPEDVIFALLSDVSKSMLMATNIFIMTAFTSSEENSFCFWVGRSDCCVKMRKVCFQEMERELDSDQDVFEFEDNSWFKDFFQRI